MWVREKFHHDEAKSDIPLEERLKIPFEVLATRLAAAPR
jgi:hypothetical protein